MARKSTILHAQANLTAAQFAVYMQMPCKLSKTQLLAGELPPTQAEFDALQAAQDLEKATKKAARAAAKAAECEAKPAAKAPKAKAAKAAKAPKEQRVQHPSRRLKIFASLQVGFVLKVRRTGSETLRLEVTKVNKKSIVLANGGARLALGKADVSLKIDGTPVEFDKLAYDASPEGEVAAAAPKAVEAPESAQAELDFIDPSEPLELVTVSAKQAERMAEAAFSKSPFPLLVTSMVEMFNNLRDEIMQGIDPAVALEGQRVVFDAS